MKAKTKQKPASDGQTKNEMGWTQNGKTRSLLSEVFKVPGTPKRKDEVVERSKSMTSFPPATDSNLVIPSYTSTPSYTKGKGKGKGKQPFNPINEGSVTEKQIWESEEKIRKLQEYVTDNPVIITSADFNFCNIRNYVNFSYNRKSPSLSKMNISTKFLSLKRRLFI